jgi:hypothetical protein
MVESNSNSKKDYLKIKFNNFKLFLEENKTDQTNQDDYKFFTEMNEEELLEFTIQNLLPNKNNLSYCSNKIIQKLQLNDNKSVQMTIENYLCLFCDILK